jgi:SAM-dependent methyltransferase
VGFDFSPNTVEAAQEETRDAGLSAKFVVADVTSGTLPAESRSFDAAVAVGCLAVACRDLASLERALAGMAGIVKPSGLVVLLEPIHSTRFLGRVLRAPVADWIAAGATAGLRLLSSSGMGFVPARLALSSLDLPPWFVRPTFAAGELALDSLPVLERAADYRLLVFRPR